MQSMVNGNFNPYYKKTECSNIQNLFFLKIFLGNGASLSSQYNSLDMIGKSLTDGQLQQQPSLNNQEDETFYTRELIHIYGQPIVPSFHKYFNYQLSNTHYGYRTLRRLLNCDILKKYVKVSLFFFIDLFNFNGSK